MTTIAPPQPGPARLAPRIRDRRPGSASRCAASSRVELRKSFDTRAGFWLLASIGIASLLTTGAVIAVRARRAVHLQHLHPGHRLPDVA